MRLPVGHRAGQGTGDAVQDLDGKTTSTALPGWPTGPVWPAPRLGPIPRMWQHLRRPPIAQRILDRPVRDPEGGQAR
jgi:hypothetical protein